MKTLGILELKLTDLSTCANWQKTLWKQLYVFIASVLSAREPSAISFQACKPEIRALKIQCSQAVVSELSARCESKSYIATENVLGYYRSLLDKLRNLALGTQKDEAFVEQRRELHWIAVQAERDAVQNLFERGAITREFAAFLRKMFRNRESTLYEIEELRIQ